MQPGRELRRSIVAGATALAVAALGLSAPTPAAASTTRPNHDSYSVTKWLAFPELFLCLNYTVSGDISYKAVRYGPVDGNIDYQLQNIQVTAPKLVVRAYQYSSASHACTRKALNWQKLSVEHAYKGYSCSYNPSISVQLPFSVGAGFWPDCGNKKTGHWNSSYGKASGWTQYNSAARIGFSTQRWYQSQISPRPKPRCYGAVIRFHVYMPGVDDTKDSGQLPVCLTPEW